MSCEQILRLDLEPTLKLALSVSIQIFQNPKTIQKSEILLGPSVWGQGDPAMDDDLTQAQQPQPEAAALRDQSPARLLFPPDAECPSPVCPQCPAQQWPAPGSL